MQHPVRKASAMLPLRRIWLFGSRARGDDHAKSDIDLAFELVGGAASARSRFVAEVHEDAKTLLPLDLINIDTCAGALRDVIVEQGVLLYENTK